MPTTCGFPNCKFRSRYRGQEDNRHFYRIPKRPIQLRQRWLGAIGRTEETVVSQAGNFYSRKSFLEWPSFPKPNNGPSIQFGVEAGSLGRDRPCGCDEAGALLIWPGMASWE
ncbi:THAP domain protein [Ditylenchus destructor]|uniref:THAP domain protein n=1 Tax=Ditylenchus destructor TaxID=166010 RepID=A0AAD4QXP4_9BILA|nr:THAP domain protein [Ditylenchus destructor]